MPMLAVLSAIAGFVDAACFVALSEVFTAHVTGNFAALASALVKPDAATLLRIAVIASFAVGAGSAVVSAHAAGAHAGETPSDAATAAALHTRVRRAVIRVEAGWLALVLIAWALLPGPLDAAHPLVRFAVASFAGAAMGCQSALSKLPGDLALEAPSTVMTSNYTAWAMALANRLMSPRTGSSRDDRTFARRSVQLVLFLLGAAAGAFGVHRAGIVVLILPLATLCTIGLLPDWSGV